MVFFAKKSFKGYNCIFSLCVFLFTVNKEFQHIIVNLSNSPDDYRRVDEGEIERDGDGTHPHNRIRNE
jgi:hypothetical protein